MKTGAAGANWRGAAKEFVALTEGSESMDLKESQGRLGTSFALVPRAYAGSYCRHRIVSMPLLWESSSVSIPGFFGWN